MSVCHKIESTETTRTAVGGTRVTDQCGSGGIRVRWHIPEGLVALGRQVPIALGPFERLCSRVKAAVAFDHNLAGGERNDEESEDREVLHACGWMSKVNWVVFV